jgi:hypothetical protein
MLPVQGNSAHVAGCYTVKLHRMDRDLTGVFRSRLTQAVVLIVQAECAAGPNDYAAIASAEQTSWYRLSARSFGT